MEHGAGVDGPHREDEEVAAQGGEGRPHGAPEGDQQGVPRQVAYRPQQRGQQAAAAAALHQIDRGQEVAQAGEGGGHGQDGHIPPRRIVLRRRQQAGGELGGPDDAGGRQEGQGGVDGEHIGEKPLLFLLRLLRQGGELPGGGEGVGHRQQHGGDLVGHGVKARGGAPQEKGDEIPVGDIDDPAAQGRRDQRDAVPEHAGGARPGDGGEAEIPPLSGPQKDKQGGKTVGQRAGEHIARDAQVQHGQQQEVEADGQHGAQNAVQGEEAHMSHGPGELVAHRVDVGRQHIEEHQPQISGEKGDLLQQGREGQQEDKPRQIDQQSRGKDAALVAAPLQAVPDHGVCDAGRGDGNEQVSRLDEQVGDAVLGAGEDTGVKGGQQEIQKPGPEGAQAKQECVEGKASIGIHTPRPPRHTISSDRPRRCDAVFHPSDHHTWDI